MFDNPYLRYLIYYIVAYAPLFAILIIQAGYEIFIHTGFEKTTQSNILLFIVFITFFIILIFAFVGFIYIVNNVKKTIPKNYSINERKNITGEGLTYVIPYILGIIGFQFTIINIISLTIILIIIYFVYINSDLIAVNPTLNILRYKTFNVKTLDGSNIFIITKEKEITFNKSLQLYLMTDKIYLHHVPKVDKTK